MGREERQQKEEEEGEEDEATIKYSRPAVIRIYQGLSPVVVKAR